MNFRNLFKVSNGIYLAIMVVLLIACTLFDKMHQSGLALITFVIALCVCILFFKQKR